MTNAELIEALKKLPLDLEVMYEEEGELRYVVMPTIQHNGEDVIVL